MKIWMVAREYDGIAEAGGVKNVVCSLSEQLAQSGHNVTFFIPQYGCTDFSHLIKYSAVPDSEILVKVGEQDIKVSYATAVIRKVNIVFVKSECYEEKNNVYTYNKKDLEKFPDACPGHGYRDEKTMDILFQKAVCEYFQFAKKAPDVVNCHDACTALLPVLCHENHKDFYRKTKFFVSIHNAGPAYHHEYKDLQEAEYFTGLSKDILSFGLNSGRVEPYVVASPYSKLMTVSYDYAKELLDFDNPNTDGLAQIFSTKRIPITGITNGIDFKRYQPEDKNISLLPFEYSPSKGNLEGKYKCRKYLIDNFAVENPSVPCEQLLKNDSVKKYGYLQEDPENKNIYISFHGRLVRQKGIFIIIELFQKILSRFDNVRFIINGQGELLLMDELIKKTNEFPGKIVYFSGYDRSFSRLVTACGDFALLPSEFEPCGLEDFIAQLYGTVPVAHATGGLNKIKNGETGFTYSPNTADTLCELLAKLISWKTENPDSFIQLVKNGAKSVINEYNWKIVAEKKYLAFYKKN